MIKDILKTYDGDCLFSPMTILAFISLIKKDNEEESEEFFDKYSIDSREWERLNKSSTWSKCKDAINMETRVFYRKTPEKDDDILKILGAVSGVPQKNMVKWLKKTYPSIENVPSVIPSKSLVIVNTAKFFSSWTENDYKVFIDKRNGILISGDNIKKYQGNSSLACSIDIGSGLEFIVCSSKNKFPEMNDMTFIDLIREKLSSIKPAKETVCIPKINIKMTDNLMDNFAMMGLKFPVKYKEKFEIYQVFHAVNFVLNEKGIGVTELDAAPLESTEEVKTKEVAYPETWSSVIDITGSSFLFFIAYKDVNNVPPLFVGRIIENEDCCQYWSPKTLIMKALGGISDMMLPIKPKRVHVTQAINFYHALVQSKESARKWLTRNNVAPVMRFVLQKLSTLETKERIIYHVLQYLDGKNFTDDEHFAYFLDKIIFGPVAVKVDDFTYWISNVFNRKDKKTRMLWRLIYLLNKSNITEEQKQIVRNNIKPYKDLVEIEEAKKWLGLSQNKQLESIHQNMKNFQKFYKDRIPGIREEFEKSQEEIREWLDENKEDEKYNDVLGLYNENEIFDALTKIGKTPKSAKSGFELMKQTPIQQETSEKKPIQQKDTNSESKLVDKLVKSALMNTKSVQPLTKCNKKKRNGEYSCLFYKLEKVINAGKLNNAEEAIKDYADIVVQEKGGEEFREGAEQEAKEALSVYPEEFQKMFALYSL